MINILKFKSGDIMKIGFIGCGNMGGALCTAVRASMEEKNCEILICDKDESKVSALCTKLSAKAASIKEISENSDFIFLGVKPANIKSVIKETVSDINNDCTLISMAAGVSIEDLAQVAGNVPIIRIMPNTPVSVGEGVILYSLKGVSEEKENRFLEILKKAGRVLKFPENLIDAGSAVSGCGPAFCYMFIEALADGAVECGIPRSDALTLAAATLSGSAKMVLETGEHPEKLKDNVCSPGGSTIAGVHALEEGGFRAAVINSVDKAYIKTKQLSK